MLYGFYLVICCTNDVMLFHELHTAPNSYPYFRGKWKSTKVKHLTIQTNGYVLCAMLRKCVDDIDGSLISPFSYSGNTQKR